MADAKYRGNVIVVGSINVDFVFAMQSLPHPGETVVGGKFTQVQGGKGANQAVAACRLGAQVWMVGAVGDDEFGKQARRELQTEGVDTSWVTTIPGIPTGVASVAVDPAGENAIVVASGANAALTAEHVGVALRAIEAEDAIVLSVLEVSDDAVAAAAQAATKRGWRFMLNPAPARKLSPDILKRCAVLTPNEHEVGSLGWPSASDLVAAGASAVVVTRGAEGADVHTPSGTTTSQQSFAVDVADTTGAGDAFSGALAWALAGGKTLPEAVRMANAAGAAACRGVGARASLADDTLLQRMVETAST